MRLLPLLIAVVLGGAAAFLVACGDRNHLIPSGQAQSLIDHLATVENAVDGRDCAATGHALAQVRGDYINLPTSVDSRLRARLRQGLDNLNTRAALQCAEQPKTLSTATTDTAVSTDTTTTETTATTTATTGPTGPTGPTSPAGPTGPTSPATTTTDTTGGVTTP